MTPDGWAALVAILTVVAVPIAGTTTHDMRIVCVVAAIGILIVLLIGVLT